LTGPLDHQAEFELLVMRKLGTQVSAQIDWSGPRLVCVASDFTRYDEHAIAQIDRSIELVRYRDYEGTFLTLDLVASTSASATAAGAEEPAAAERQKRSASCMSNRRRACGISRSPSAAEATLSGRKPSYMPAII